MDHVNVDEEIKVITIVVGVGVVTTEEFRHFMFDNTTFVQGQ